MSKKKSKYYQRPAKNKLLAYGFSKDIAQDAPEETKNIDKLKNAWIPFGDDNLFPQHLSELARSASTHRAILNTKTTFTIGEGFRTLDDKFSEYIKDVNASGESLDDVMRKVISDYWTHGNAYIEIVMGKGYINLYHQDATTARVGKTKDKILFHPDWANVRKSESKVKSLDIYPNFRKYTKGIQRAVIHFSDYESTYYYYGLPDYVAALDHIKIANQIGKYNLTRFKNGFMPSAIIELGADMSEEEAQQFIDEAKDKLTGENNNSKMLFIAKNGDESASNVQVINDTSDGSFMELQTITNDNIISAHRWNPALSGIQVAGSLGNNQQILTIYDIVMSTVVKEPQRMIIRELQKVLSRQGGYNVDDLHIVNKPPVTMLGAINPTDYISVQEGRKIFHLPELTEDELESLLIEKNKIKDGVNNSSESN
jgi:hypothetical protein|tara:strand:+ start:25571 stop:26851 length:1281 start_codon:yes stop_codon:yes gene_type:complete